MCYSITNIFQLRWTSVYPCNPRHVLNRFVNIYTQQSESIFSLANTKTVSENVSKWHWVRLVILSKMPGDRNGKTMKEWFRWLFLQILEPLALPHFFLLSCMANCYIFPHILRSRKQCEILTCRTGTLHIYTYNLKALCLRWAGGLKSSAEMHILWTAAESLGNIGMQTSQGMTSLISLWRHWCVDAGLVMHWKFFRTFFSYKRKWQGERTRCSRKQI